MGVETGKREGGIRRLGFASSSGMLGFARRLPVDGANSVVPLGSCNAPGRLRWRRCETLWGSRGRARWARAGEQAAGDAHGWCLGGHGGGRWSAGGDASMETRGVGVGVGVCSRGSMAML